MAQDCATTRAVASPAVPPRPQHLPGPGDKLQLWMPSVPVSSTNPFRSLPKPFTPQNSTAVRSWVGYGVSTQPQACVSMALATAMLQLEKTLLPSIWKHKIKGKGESFGAAPPARFSPPSEAPRQVPWQGLSRHISASRRP